MDSKAMFDYLVSSGGDDMAGMEQELTSMMKEMETLDYARILQKPEIQRLLSSKLMRDAVEATEVKSLLFLYDIMFENVKQAKTEQFGDNVAAILFYGIPALLLVGVLGFLTYMILSRWRARDQARRQKKMLKEQKKQKSG